MVKVRIDLSEASEGGAFNPRHVEEGDYIGKIKACEVNVSKAGNKQLLFSITADEIRGATYPYYCPLEGKGAWKIRGIIEAIGKKAPKSAAAVDTDLFIGKAIGFELVDDEYDGRVKSIINQIFAATDANKADGGVDDPEDEDDDMPPPKKTITKRKPAPVVEDEDEEEFEDEEEEVPTPPKRRSKPAPEPEPEDDEEEEEEPAPRRRAPSKKATPAKKAAARKPQPPVDDDGEDLDEMDIEEI